MHGRTLYYPENKQRVGDKSGKKNKHLKQSEAQRQTLSIRNQISASQQSLNGRTIIV